LFLVNVYLIYCNIASLILGRLWLQPENRQLLNQMERLPKVTTTNTTTSI